MELQNQEEKVNKGITPDINIQIQGTHRAPRDRSERKVIPRFWVTFKNSRDKEEIPNSSKEKKAFHLDGLESWANLGLLCRPLNA